MHPVSPHLIEAADDTRIMRTPFRLATVFLSIAVTAVLLPSASAAYVEPPQLRCRMIETDSLACWTENAAFACATVIVASQCSIGYSQGQHVGAYGHVEANTECDATTFSCVGAELHTIYGTLQAHCIFGLDGAIFSCWLPMPTLPDGAK